MSQKAIDRRTARTRTTLRHALISLILEKGYDATTIKDICDEANIGRSTFYAHYASKDDLKRSGLEQLRDHLIERQQAALASSGGEERALGFTLPMFEHARDHLHLYRALKEGLGGKLALNTIREMLSDLLRNELATTGAKPSEDTIPRELIVQHVVGAYMAVLTWWLDQGAKLPPDRIDTMFRQFVLRGITPY